MGVNYNTRIVNRGAVVAVDAANPACVASTKLRRNLLTFPEDFANSAWPKTNTTVQSAAGIAPDGTLSLNKFIANTTNDLHFYYRGLGTLANGSYTYSIYTKYGGLPKFLFYLNQVGGSASTIVTFTNGVVSVSVASVSGSIYSAATSRVVDAGNGIYRIILSFTVTGSAGDNAAILLYSPDGTTAGFAGNGFDGIYIWGAQLEPGVTPSDYYPVSATGFPTIVNDLSLSKFVGTLVNNITYDPRNSGSLVYDNVSAHIDLPQLPSQTNQPLSVFAWVYLNTLPTISSGIWGHYGTNSSNCHFECYSTYTRIRLGDINNTTLPIMVTGAWQHVGFTSSGIDHKYYINGALITTWTGTTGTILGGESPGHFIGKSDLPRPWNGRISHTVVYNVELTALEVQQNFNALKGRHGL